MSARYAGRVEADHPTDEGTTALRAMIASAGGMEALHATLAGGTARLTTLVVDNGPRLDAIARGTDALRERVDRETETSR